MLEAGVGVGEPALLWLEDGVGAIARCYDIESHKDVIVSMSYDVLGHG